MRWLKFFYFKFWDGFNSDLNQFVKSYISNISIYKQTYFHWKHILLSFLFNEPFQTPISFCDFVYSFIHSMCKWKQINFGDKNDGEHFVFWLETSLISILNWFANSNSLITVVAAFVAVTSQTISKPYLNHPIWGWMMDLWVSGIGWKFISITKFA